MSDLVSLSQLKAELRLTPEENDENDVLQRKLDEAEAMCLDYVSQRLGDTADAWAEEVQGWRDAEPEDVPATVVGAILDYAVMLHRFRGDDVELPKWWGDGRLPPSVRMKLDRLRDHTIA